MTEQEIAKLGAQADRYDSMFNALSGIGVPPGPFAAPVARLLEERRRLLGALRPLTEGTGAMTYRKMMYEYGMEHVVKQTDAALAAIAFAEEESK